MIKSNGLEGSYRKVTITLRDTQENFIDELRKKIKKNGGFSLGRTEVIRSAIQFMSLLDLNPLDLSKIKNEEDLINGLRICVRAVKKK